MTDNAPNDDATFQKKIDKIAADFAAKLKPSENTLRATAELQRLYQQDTIPTLPELQSMTSYMADVNAPGENGMTLLLWILSHGEKPNDPGFDRDNFHELLSHALRCNADLSLKTPDGLSVEDLARRCDTSSVVLNMLNREAVRRADPVLKQLVPEIALSWPLPDWPATDNVRERFVSNCLYADEFDFMRYCLYIYPDAKDWSFILPDTNIKHPVTGLMAAALGSDSNLQVLNYLIAQGCNLDAQDEDGNTALMHAATSRDNPQILETLANSGADLLIRNKAGQTALDRAVADDNDTAKYYLNRTKLEQEKIRAARVLESNQRHLNNPSRKKFKL